SAAPHEETLVEGEPAHLVAHVLEEAAPVAVVAGRLAEAGQALGEEAVHELHEELAEVLRAARGERDGEAGVVALHEERDLHPPRAARDAVARAFAALRLRGDARLGE